MNIRKQNMRKCISRLVLLSPVLLFSVASSAPELRLFNSKSTANFCTLYQKDCTLGETVTIGKWAVPVILR
jgi:hypothetical protein